MDVPHVLVGPDFFCRRRRRSCRGRGVRVGRNSRGRLSLRRWRSRVPRRSSLTVRTSLRACQTRHQHSRCKSQDRYEKQRSPVHDASPNDQQVTSELRAAKSSDSNINWTKGCRAALGLLCAHCDQVEPRVDRRVTGRRTALCRWPVRPAPLPTPAWAARCADIRALRRTGAARM
jgi:hypothetical protein